MGATRKGTATGAKKGTGTGAGKDADRARSSLRFTLGHTSTDADVDALVSVIGPVVERARRAGMGRR